MVNKLFTQNVNVNDTIKINFIISMNEQLWDHQFLPISMSSNEKEPTKGKLFYTPVNELAEISVWYFVVIYYKHSHSTWIPRITAIKWTVRYLNSG